MPAKSKQSNPIKLSNVRLSFPKLAKPQKYDEADENEIPKYSAAFLLDPSDESHAKIIKEIKLKAKQTIDETWGKKPPKFKPIDCYGDGNDQVNDDGNVYDGYENMFVIKGNTAKRPIVLKLSGGDKTPLDKDEIEDVLYGGCYVNGSVHLWTQDHPKWGKRINCTLRGVMFRRDGEAFGNTVNIDEEFEDDFDDDDDDFDL